MQAARWTIELKERAERAALGRLDAMQQYCETDECLRRVLLDYFGEDQDRSIVTTAATARTWPTAT